MIIRLVAGIVGSALLASLGISRVTAQGSSALAQSQAEGVRMALQAANDQLAAMGARTRMSQGRVVDAYRYGAGRADCVLQQPR